MKIACTIQIATLILSGLKSLTENKVILFLVTYLKRTRTGWSIYRMKKISGILITGILDVHHFEAITLGMSKQCCHLPTTDFEFHS